MKKNTIITIILYLIAIGVILGLFLYKSNEIKLRENTRNFQRFQAEQNNRKHVEGQKKVNDAEYQVREAYHALEMLEESPGSTSRTTYYRHKKKEIKKNLSYWIGVREEELNEELKQAEESGDAREIEQCQQELTELYDKKQALYND